MNDQENVNPFSAPLAIEPSPPLSDRVVGPEGIGGWLILVTIGLVLTPLRMAYLLLTLYLPLFTRGQFSVLTNPDSDVYHPLWGPLLILEVIGNLAFGIAAVVALFLMFKRLRIFPKFMIGYYAGNLGFIGLDTVISNLIPGVAESHRPEAAMQIAKSMIACVIWIPYMCRSIRVKNTFVR